VNRPSRQRKLFYRLLIAALLISLGFAATHIGIRALYPVRYADTVEKYCSEFNIDPSLAYAVIHTESGFDPEARSEAGAMGLMQIMPETFHWLQGRLEPDTDLPDDALYNPSVNIRYGVYYLSLLDEMFSDDTLTIAAYHAGQNRVSGWLKDCEIPESGCTADDIPSSATGHYVHKVRKARDFYDALYD